MNQRIQEFWDKAAESTKDDSWQSHTLFMERFAELIVKECAEIALREDHDPHECILKHFGLKS
jgi:hypothetical protein